MCAHRIAVLQTYPFYIPNWSWYWGVCGGGYCTSLYVYTGDIPLVCDVVQSEIKCDDGSQCGRPKTGRLASENFRSIHVPYYVIDPVHGASQRVSSVSGNNAISRGGCDKCPAQLTKEERFVRLPMVLSLFACAQQVTIGHNPLQFADCYDRQWETAANCLAKFCSF